MTDLADLLSEDASQDNQPNNGQVRTPQGDKVELDAQDPLKKVIEEIAESIEKHTK